MTGARTLASLDDVLAAIEPGETVDYSDLLVRMKRIERPTAGVGMLLDHYSNRPGRSGAIVAWQEPEWDAEATGGWAPGVLKIRRRPSSEEEGSSTTEGGQA